MCIQIQVTGWGKRDSDNSRDEDRLRWAKRGREAQFPRSRGRKRSGEGRRGSKRQAASGGAHRGNKTPVGSISLRVKFHGMPKHSVNKMDDISM